MSGPRVVSLVPSVTETLLAWGVTPVACTRFCEQPALTHVGGTKNPDVAAIVALAPDLVVVNDEENRKEDADALAQAGLDVHVVTVEAVDDVGPAFADLATRLGVRYDGPTLPPVPTQSATASRAFIPIWRRPWMTMNARTYGSSLLARLGVTNVFAGHHDRYPETTIEEIASLAPDVVLAPSEPYPFSHRHEAELATIAPVTFVDGRDLFWWGVRTPEAITRLRRALPLPKTVSADGGAGDR